MSGLGIEGKFLVHKNMNWKSLAGSYSHIQQGYFATVNTVRVRVKDDKGYLTIKGPPRTGGLSRYEFEKEITLEEAQQLMLLCEPGVIDKHHYLVLFEGHTFEIDEFHGDNGGLVLAEMELGNGDESFDKPDFIGLEITGSCHFYNPQMHRNPFKLWRDIIPEKYR